MTVTHYTPLTVILSKIRKEANRVKAKEHSKREVAQGLIKSRFGKHVWNREAYDAAKAFNEAHGLHNKLDHTQRTLRAYTAMRNGRKHKPPITLAGPNWNDMSKPGTRRVAAERRMVERIAKAVEILSFGIEELSNVYDPTELIVKKDRPLGTSLEGLVNLTQTLASYGRLPIPQYGRQQHSGAQPNEKVCINCRDRFVGLGSSCPQCELDRKNTRLAEISADRRARAQNNLQIARDIKKISKTIRQTEKRMRDHD
jgi:hypothetical protein